MPEIVERIWIECRKCEHKWYPNPNMWKNYTQGKDKLIQCPKCMATSWIPSDVAESIIVSHREKRTIANWGVAKWGAGPID